MFKILIFVSCFSGFVYSTQIFIGDLCIHKGLNVSGSCQLISNCPSAVENLKNHNIVPENCGFKKYEPIVCCTTGSTPVETPAALKEGDVGYISSIKCKQYGERVFEEIDVLPLVENGSKKLKLDTCESNIQAVYFGNVVREREFPHMVQVGFDKKGEKIYSCSANLISDNYVLSTANCLIDREYGDAKFVRLGVLGDYKNLFTDQKGLQERNIERVIQHPKFVQKQIYNNIALAKLDKNVEFTRYVRPICLSPGPKIRNNFITALGWPVNNVGTSNITLQKIDLSITKLDNCQIYLTGSRKKDKLTDTQICAGNMYETKNCLEPGGPIQVTHTDVYCMFTLVGVKSFGSTCLSTGLEVYTNVSKYLDWIEKTVWPQEI